MTAVPATATHSASWALVLPASLLAVPLANLGLGKNVIQQLSGAGLLTVHDALLAAQQTGELGPLTDGVGQEVRGALANLLLDTLVPFAANACDWPSVRAQLLGPLSPNERQWLDELIGFEQEPPHAAVLARQLGITTQALADRAERLRGKLAEGASHLLTRCHHEASKDLAAFEGVLLVEHAAEGSLMQSLARTAPDRALGLRLIAFLFPREFHCQNGALFGLPPRRFRQLLRVLPSQVPPHRLPLSIDLLLTELAGLDLQVPRGVLLHVLRKELHIAIELDAEMGEVAAADPRTPAARLVELLQEVGQPMALADLVFAYRERFRHGTAPALCRQLRLRREFVLLGPDVWGLRSDHEKELLFVTPLVDKVARRLCSEGGRQHVADLLPDDERDERTVHYVLDRLAHDPRVRMLGRGDACAASHRRSRVMETLLEAMRKAAGDVVLSLFLDNQPAAHRRLIARLLRDNRLFVQPAADRVDTLANWPFNEERMQRLLVLVQKQLRHRSGYAHGAALKAAVDRTDLGGDWLTVQLLTDVLRRNGPFEVLPGDIVARAELALPAQVMRSVRAALREAKAPLSVEEVLRARPDLGEFASCLAQLLAVDPLLQSQDGVHFMLA